MRPPHLYDRRALLAAGLALLAPAEARAARRRPAYFRFVTDPFPEVFTVRIDSPARIRHARRLLAGRTEDRARIGGRIVKMPAPYNPGFAFHLDPASIRFFDMSAEAYDATVRYVAEHLEEVGGEFLPGNLWLPWSSRLVEEVTFPARSRGA